MKLFFNSLAQLWRTSPSKLADNAHLEHDWIIEFTSRSREDFVKISSIIARGFDNKIFTNESFLLNVEGPVSSGKTLIIDSFIYDITDGKNCFTAPADNKMMLESRPDEAMSKTLSKKFTINGRNRAIAFRNFCTTRSRKINKQKRKAPIVFTSYNYYNEDRIILPKKRRHIKKHKSGRRYNYIFPRKLHHVE